MKLKSISPNELLAKSRYCDGTDGQVLLDKYSDAVFDTFDSWERLGRKWGYTELPSGLCRLFAYTASRECSLKLSVEILFRLHYPNLQCAALAWVKDPEVLFKLAQKLSEEARNSEPVFLSILEIWNWRLNRMVDAEEDKDRWIKGVAPDYIRKMYEIVLKLGFAKLFAKWLFNKRYRDWTDIRGVQSAEKQLHYLMEAVIVASWDASQIDTDSCDIDYLTFLATDIDEYHPLSTADVNKVLDGYNRLFGDLSVNGMSLPLSGNMLQRLCGFSEMFWKANQSNLAKQVDEWIKKYECIFEGWKVKGKMHDYRHVQRESFLLSAMLEMCIRRVTEVALKTQICNIIIDHLLRQQNCCDDLYLEYYNAAFCIARQAQESISVVNLYAYDERLISSHRNMECVLNIINCSGSIPLSAANKKMLEDRWQYEHEAWEGRLTTTHQMAKYDLLVRMVNAFTK